MRNKKIVMLQVLLAMAAVGALPVLIGYAAPSGGTDLYNVDANFNTVTTNSADAGSITNNGGLDLRGFAVNSGAANNGALAIKDNAGLSILDEATGTSALKLTPSGIEQVASPDVPVTVTDSNGFAVADSTGTIGLNIAANGDISSGSSSDTNPVRINDSYGLRIDGITKGLEAVVTGTATAGIFTTNGNAGVSATANGASGIGGNFTGTATGISGTATGAAGTGVSGNGVSKGVAGTATGASGRGGDFTANGGSAIAVSANSSSGTAGQFNGRTTIAKLGTSTAAIDATGIIKNAGLSIDANGDIHNDDVARPVYVNDPQGLQSSSKIDATDGTAHAALWSDGGVQADGNLTVEGMIYNLDGRPSVNNPTDDVMINDNLYLTGNLNGNGNGVFINDANGVNITATNANAGLTVNNPIGGIQVNAANGGMTINSLSGGGGLTINSSTGGLTLNSTSLSAANGMQTKNNSGVQTMNMSAQNGTAWFKGKVTSDTGFGTYNLRSVYIPTVPAWSPIIGNGTANLTVNCASGETAVSCGFSTNYLKAIRPAVMYPSGANCQFTFANTSGASYATGYALCLDPSS